MKRNFLLLLLVAFGLQMAAQDENLVPNGDFENSATKGLKSYGMLDDLCEDWFSGTKAPADLYATGMKSEKVNIPNNLFGKQDAMSGEMYAGFRAYTKDKKKNRTYLQVKLSEDLEEDVQYCVKINISLADLSKYAVNNIGVYMSDRKIVQPNTGPMIKDDFQIKHKSNKVMMSQEGWETICGTIVGTGEEEYMIIGCFERDDKLQIEKMKRPKGMTGTQVYDAYYYIDNVEVYPIEAKSQCICSRADEVEPDLIYSKSVMIDESMTPSDVVKNSSVYYAFLKSGVNAIARRSLTNVIKIMNENPNMKLEVIGHCDNDEFDEAKINPRYKDLGKRRADMVVEYLIEQGISQMRLVPKSLENTSPANTRPTPLSKAQNRRVQFVVY